MEVKGLSPEMYNVVAGRTLTVEVGNSALAGLVRLGRRTGVEDHGRPSNGIIGDIPLSIAYRSNCGTDSVARLLWRGNTAENGDLRGYWS